MAGMHSTVSRLPLAAAVMVVLGPWLAGCQALSYYSQAVAGQWRVLAARQPVDEVLAGLTDRRSAEPAADLLYRRLRYSQQVLDFAQQTLALDVGKRYRSYVDLGRPAVVWNLFAAPPLSLEPHRWCYPVVGCAPYRGYFDADMARRDADTLAAQGLETYLGPVPAYSTLGWFADPLLSSFITWPEPDLAELLFHELAHGRVWARGDVAFNESFATFVGRRGLSAWLEHQGQTQTLAARAPALAARDGVLALLDRTRSALQAVYSGPRDDAGKRAAKARILGAAQACYEAARSGLGAGRYDALVRGLDNAKLVSVATYEDLVPGFAALFEAAHGDWTSFYGRVQALASADPATRRARLTVSVDQQVAADGDDQRADEVECDALPRHVLDAEPAGGVHDDVGRGSDR